MILVSGATGNVGGELVAALAREGRPVRALVRGEPAPGRLPEGAEPVVGDLNDPASLRPALDGVRGAFLLPGYADMPGALAELRAAGVAHVVLLSSISVPDGDLGNAVSRFMIRSEEAVREADLPWTILRPSGFMSNTFQWKGQLAAGDVVEDAFGDVAIASVDPYDIGAVAARVLLDKEHVGQTYALSGPRALLPGDRLRLLGEALGRELTFVGLSDAEARRRMDGTMPEEYVEAFFRYYGQGSEHALDDSVVRPGVRQVLGRGPREFAQWARAHAGEFTDPKA
ncbi:SDR family oxidoreductase [Streptomyces sp. NPDC091377]|uniref:SDR family oxidoreductase n=1 Tax=Streptomyces sp. NPDC091377 TaxID=3365995 RepID=UPI003811FFFC